MKYAHSALIKVFIKEHEPKDSLLRTLHELFPFNLAEEEIPIHEDKVQGFEDTITIYSVKLKKTRHTTAFLKQLLDQLGDKQRTQLREEAPTRLSDELIFYLRLDKTALLEKKKHTLTESGDCFHISFKVAAFPKKREVALDLIEKLLNGQ